MSKSRIAMAMAGVAMVALGVLPSAAQAGVRLRMAAPSVSRVSRWPACSRSQVSVTHAWRRATAESGLLP